VLYVTELIGLLLIYTGYRACITAPAPAPRKLEGQATAPLAVSR
jgi:hypothetical protein